VVIYRFNDDWLSSTTLWESVGAGWMGWDEAKPGMSIAGAGKFGLLMMFRMRV
jgi:hypothetical protein